jgi:FtsZ-binding cell division protein ZapB
LLANYWSVPHKSQGKSITFKPEMNSLPAQSMDQPMPLDALEVKVKKMITLHLGLKAQIQSLQADNQVLTQQILGLQEALRKLEDENQLLKLARTLDPGSESRESTELKGKLSEMIRDIDKCLALLNR